MSVLSNHKSFEQSLRSTSPFAPLLRPIRSEIHKGCTGKAHGCGTRKNSRSTTSSLSDSSSEVSPALSVESEISKQRTVVRRKDGVSNSSESLPKGLQRNGSIRASVKRTKSVSVDSKPPWHNVYTAKLKGLNTDSENHGVRKDSVPDKGKIVTRRPSIKWQDLYDRAVNQKPFGGSYMRCPSVVNSTQSSHDQVIIAINWDNQSSFVVGGYFLDVVRVKTNRMRLY